MKEVERSNGDTPQILYHYTTSEGLIGIVTSGKLWATERRFLNDKGEISHGTSLLKHHRADLETMIAEDWNNDPMARKSAQRWRKLLKDWHKKVLVLNWFIASLCEEPDLLTQWISYGHEAGFSVGISTDHLNRGYGDKGTIFEPVLYDEEAQRDMLLRRATDFIHLDADARKSTSQKKKKKTPSLQSRIALSADLDLLACKGGAFEQEREWRLCRWDVNDRKVRFRSSPRLGIVPYTRINLRKGAESRIREIWIGPSEAQEEAFHAVSTLLASVGLEDQVTIKKSPIELRW